MQVVAKRGAHESLASTALAALHRAAVSCVTGPAVCIIIFDFCHTLRGPFGVFFSSVRDGLRADRWRRASSLCHIEVSRLRLVLPSGVGCSSRSASAHGCYS
ncbi:hypothetical protein EJ03DRAFT_34921 [Teratosphaeria nubilosa]|uniref:Uncharacterized protein n=1 Tax=Teratosphaeria nubilosa TaxID=161662 RepID=A0A6G1KUB1_9PEZI|nr:hypothetical protein EJ03DRAFT_34921 [Teratosphaeria nubilosa]